MNVIMISGWAGSGKDTATNYFLNCIKNSYRISFADVLKDSVASMYGIDRKSLDDRDLKESPILSLPLLPKDKFSTQLSDILINSNAFKEYNGKKYWTPRGLAILIGSVNRTVDPNFWVKQAISKMKDNSATYIISDWRYRNESEAMEDLLPEGTNFLKLRINRFNNTLSQDSSERDLDNYEFDYIINNNKAIDDFNVNLYNLISELKVKL